MNLPELHYTGDVSWREDTTDVVKISHVQTSVDAPGQGHGRQQLIAQSLSVAAGTGDAPAPAIPHDGGDDGRLQWDELVLPTAFVQNTWETEAAVTHTAVEKAGQQVTESLFILYWKVQWVS